LNLLYLVPGETGGMETYARRLIPELLETGGDLQFVLFLNREAYADEALRAIDDRVQTVRLNFSGRSRSQRAMAEQVLLPRMARRQGVDLLHSLGSTAPIWSAGVGVVTIHDLIYLTHPEAHSRMMRIGMSVLVPLAARKASRIIADSKATATDISSRLGVSRDRIDVIHLGGLPPGPATDVTELRARLGLGDSPIVLSPSARRGHKNLSRLLHAFAALNTEPRPLLALPGYATALDAELKAEARQLGIEDRVKLLGWLSDPDLEGLYEAASCFVFPSLAEGFGLPVLEAMERGVPVAASRASAIPEVGGDAVRYFDPLRVLEIRAAMEELLCDQATAAQLATAGQRRAREFSWKRAAERTVDVYRRVWAESRS
jgi:glycosyltransferase involved in cell wall biosynthesis